MVLPYKLTGFLIKSFCEKQLKVDMHMRKEDFNFFIVLKCMFLTFFPCVFVLPASSTL